MCRWNDWGKPCICVQQVKLFGKRCGGEGGRGERRIIACGIQCAGAIWGKVSLSSSKTRILQLSLWPSPAALQCTEAPHTLVELLLYYCWVIPSPPRCALDLARARNTYARGHSLTHTHTHTLSFGLALFHMHTHTLSLSFFHTRSHAPISQQHFWWCLSANSYVVRPSGGSDRGSAIFFFHFDTKCEKELREIKYWSRSPEACSQNNNCLEMFLVGSCRRLKFFFSFEWKWSAPFPGLPVSNGLKLKLKFWKKKIKLKQKIKNSVGEVDRKKIVNENKKRCFRWIPDSDFLETAKFEVIVRGRCVWWTFWQNTIERQKCISPRSAGHSGSFKCRQCCCHGPHLRSYDFQSLKQFRLKSFFFATAKIDSIMFILVLGHIVNFRKGLFEFRKNS